MADPQKDKHIYDEYMSGKTYQEIANENGSTRGKVARAIANHRKRLDQELIRVRHKKSDNEWTISLDHPSIVTIEELVKYCKVDFDVWEYDRAAVNSWPTTAKDKIVDLEWTNGKVNGYIHQEGLHSKTNLSIKVWLRRKKFIWDKETIDKIFENINTKKLKFNIPKKYKKEAECLVVPIADLHLGLNSIKEVTGDAYNMDIAEKLVEEGIGKIKQATKTNKFEEIVLIVGNDFMNSDNLSGTTTHGTQQDTHAFWFSVVDRAINLIIKSVNSLLEISKVYVYCVLSNHDEHSMYTIMKVIEKTFEGNKNVFIDTSPLPRKYHKFGKSIIGLSHDMTIKRGLEIMTTEAKEHWTNCDYFYWLLAHKHKGTIYEPQGHLELYRLPAISGMSKWSAGKGFIQAEKKLQWFILDKKNGIVANMKIPL